ncbi:hypothetical protein [Agrobacterium tumefaciens]|uniref:hypothetical protein n=1 Tax=Agrobacterium tumefaciens TaxID=358 RepID=UPI001571B11D|nr:hypothetical protein [Agrobacterium tumefaciens]NTE34670.1 hypothetical protein [Agrobacterium tumefaciens]NTE50180.1 hypothetical protein [Agrobacterium tumefaciens]
MEAMQAVVLTQLQLDNMLREAARQGASLAVAELRTEIHQSPDEVTLQRLRTYLSNPGGLYNPHNSWAHSGIIRQIEPTPRGKPKSSAWFMKFQRESGLSGCYTRPSPAYGRRREWSFADIRLAWEIYYRRS